MKTGVISWRSRLLSLLFLAMAGGVGAAAPPAVIHFSNVFSSAAGGTETETLSARLPLTGVNVKQFTAQTPFHLQLGAFTISETLGNDPKYIAGKSTKATFTFKGQLGANSAFTYLLVDLSWNAEALSVTVSATPQKQGVIFNSVSGVIAGSLAGMPPGPVRDLVIGSVLLGGANANFDVFASGSIVKAKGGVIEVSVTGGGDQTEETLDVNANDPLLADLQAAAGTLTFEGIKSGGLATAVTSVVVVSGGKTALFLVDSNNLPSDFTVSNGTQFHIDWASTTAGIVTAKLLGGVYAVNFPITLAQAPSTAQTASPPTTGLVTFYPVLCSSLPSSGLIVRLNVSGPGQSFSLTAQSDPVSPGFGRYIAQFPLPDPSAGEQSLYPAKNSAFLAAGQALSSFQEVGHAIALSAATEMAATVKPPPYAPTLKAAVAELAGDMSLITGAFLPHDSALTTQTIDIVKTANLASQKTESVVITPVVRFEGTVEIYLAKTAKTSGALPTFYEELPVGDSFGVEPRFLNNAKIGDTAQITTSFPVCFHKSKHRKCTSGNSGVATVSSGGLITCVGPGTTWISVEINDYLQYVWINVESSGTSPASTSPSGTSPSVTSPSGSSPSSSSPESSSPSSSSPSTSSPTTSSPSTSSPSTSSPSTSSPSTSSPSSSSPSSSSPSSSSPSSSSPSSSSPSSSSPSSSSPSSSSPSSSSPSSSSPGGGSGC